MRQLTLSGFGALIVVVALFAWSVAGEADTFFSHFEIREVAIKGHKLHIRGETDLPKGSVAHVRLNLPFIDSGPGKAPNVKVHLNGKQFFVQVKLPKGAKKGNLLKVGLLFRPSDQEERIRDKVGRHGEKLKGPKVKTAGGEKTLETWRDLVF